MIVTLRSTTKIVSLRAQSSGSLPGEMPARIWEGTTNTGIKVHAYITRIAVNAEQNQKEFERELQACTPPSKEIEAIPMRMII
jgi:hypothetical protein